MIRTYIIGIGLLLVCLTTSAQKFFNLTAEQVRIDSLLPVFTYRQALGYHYADSVYDVSIAYPEYIPMSEADILRYQSVTDAPLTADPDIAQGIAEIPRKRTRLHTARF